MFLVWQTKGPWITAWRNVNTGHVYRYRGMPRFGIQLRTWSYLRLTLFGRALIYNKGVWAWRR